MTAKRLKPIDQLTHEEYRERYVPKFPEGKDWEEMSSEERRLFVRQSTESHYRRGYDEARALRQVWDTTPEWDELTDEQRESIRETQRENAREMQEFGQSLAAKR